MARTIDDVSCLEIYVLSKQFFGAMDGLTHFGQENGIDKKALQAKAYSCANDAANIPIPIVGKGGSEKAQDSTGTVTPSSLSWSLFSDSEKYVVLWAILTMGLVALSFNKSASKLAVGLAFGVFFAVAVTIMRHRKMI